MTLLPASRTRTETAIDETTQRILDVPTPGADLWSPDTCPADLLPWLAWAFSVEVWNAAWPVAVKRSVIRDAVRVHRLKGTRKAVEIALAALGFRIDIVEGWEDGGDPHRFRLDAYGADVFATGFAIDDRLFARISRVIETVKPVRSHFNLRIGESFEVGAVLRNDVRPSRRQRLDQVPQPRTHETDTDLSARSGHRMTNRHRHVHFPAPRADTPSGATFIRAGLRQRLASRMTHDFQPREGAAYAV